MSIDIVRMYSVQVRYKNTTNKLNVYILNINKKPLLGREWIPQLKIPLEENNVHIATIFNNELNKI